MRDSLNGRLAIPAKKTREISKIALTEQGWDIKEDSPLLIYAVKPAKKKWGIEYPTYNLEIELEAGKTAFKFRIRTDSGDRSAAAVADRMVELADQDVDAFYQKSPAEQEAATREAFDAHVFISYAREDFAFVDKLATDLGSFAFSSFVDKASLRVGDTWPDKLKLEIAAANALIMIISPASVASEWVERELKYARAKKKLILPVLFTPTEIPQNLSRYIANIQHADLSRRNYRRGLFELADAIKRNIL